MECSQVEGEAPSLRKGALKLIVIEMKRAAGHNKTHVSGLESFAVSPDAIAQAPSRAADHVFGAAREHGLAEGVAIPVFGADGARGSLSLGGARMELKDTEIAMLEIAANLAVETATAVAGHRKTARDLGLTTREYDCLRWTADGKTDRDIAELLGLAVRTVEDHGASLRRKLDAVNRAHLVTRAFRSGLLR